MEAGLDVSIISPHTDAYKTTPLSRVADGSADFAITPSVSVTLAATCNGNRIAYALLASH